MVYFHIQKTDLSFQIQLRSILVICFPSSFSRQESLAILENVHQHITYITSSIKYIRGNWSTHDTLEDQSEDLSNLEKLSREAGGHTETI